MDRVSGFFGLHLRGTLYAAGAGVLWGLSGTAAQVLFQHHGITAQWLVATRMLASAAILLGLLRPAWPRGHLVRLVAFGIFGLAMAQYTYFAAISLMGVALATFVQYLSLPMIALWEGLIGARRMRSRTLAAVGLAMLGTALLLLAAPRGAGGFGVSAAGLAFGLLSALAAAFYTLYSVGIVRDLGPWRSNAWGFLVGGLAMLLAAPPWSVHPTGDPLVLVLLTGFVVVLGTLIPFGLYLAALRRISPTEVGTAVTIEPVSAAVASALLLGATLVPVQYAGGVAIILAVLLVRAQGGRAAPAVPEAAAAEVDRVAGGS
jgi:drug/metabolite transporter (DMT)-like permease